MSDDALSHEAVLARLPHRAPFILVERVRAWEPGVWGEGLKAVSANEPVLAGHFPGNPLLPGVYLTEAMAQLSGLVAMGAVEGSEGRQLVLVALDRVRMRRPVRPGDQLLIRVDLEVQRNGMWRFKGQVTVDDELCCEGRITLADPAVAADA